MLKRNYESIPKLSPIFWIVFQKYRHYLGIGGFSWEREQGVSESTFISPQMYKRCRFWRNKTLKMLLTGFELGRETSVQYCLLTYEPLLLLYYTESYAPKPARLKNVSNIFRIQCMTIYKSVSTNCNLFISQLSNCFANPLCIFTCCRYHQIAKSGFF